MSKLSRRSLMTSAAALPALAVPAVAAATPDPIFAAIEAHRKARAETDARNADACKVEAEWFSLRTSSTRETEIAAAEARTDAAREVERQASDRASNVAGILISAEPTTIAGVCALLTYYADLEVIDCGMVLPRFEDDDDPAVAKHGSASAGCFVARTACSALAKIVQV